MPPLRGSFTSASSAARSPGQKELKRTALFEAKHGLGGEGGLGKAHTGDEWLHWSITVYFSPLNSSGNAHIKGWLLSLRGIPLILGHANEQGLLRAPTPDWGVQRHCQTAHHGNYIPRDGIQLDQTLPKQFALALFTGIARHGSTSFISQPCCKISGWTSLGSHIMAEKGGKEGFGLLQKNGAGICVSVSAHSGFRGCFSLVARSLWWDVSRFPSCLPDPIWRKQLSPLWVSAAKQVFTSRNKGSHVYDKLKLPLQC